MNTLLDLVLKNFTIFMLIAVRITGIFVAAPVFARNNLPALMKVGLSVTISFILLPVLQDSTTIVIDSFIHLTVYAITEFLIGILIGFIAFVYFTSIYLAGTIIDTQMGFGMVNVFDPQTNTQIPVMGNFYNNIISLLFIVVNGHHLLIKALVNSFRILPIGYSLNLDIEAVNLMTRIFIEIFVLAAKFSAPVLLAIFFANVLLGVLARTMPQMNVFVVGLPLKIIVGMVTVIISLQYLLPFAERLFDRMFIMIYEMLQILSKG